MSAELSERLSEWPFPVLANFRGFIHPISTQLRQCSAVYTTCGVKMLRISSLILAFALPAGTSLAQNRIDTVPNRGGFSVVAPANKPFAIAPVRQAAIPGGRRPGRMDTGANFDEQNIDNEDSPRAQSTAAPGGAAPATPAEPAEVETEDKDTPAAENDQEPAEGGQNQPAGSGQRQAAPADPGTADQPEG